MQTMNWIRCQKLMSKMWISVCKLDPVPHYVARATKKTMGLKTEIHVQSLWHRSWLRYARRIRAPWSLESLVGFMFQVHEGVIIARTDFPLHRSQSSSMPSWSKHNVAPSRTSLAIRLWQSDAVCGVLQCKVEDRLVDYPLHSSAKHETMNSPVVHNMGVESSLHSIGQDNCPP